MGKELSLAIKIGGKLDGSLSAAVNSAQAQLNRLSSRTNKILTAGTIALAAAGAKLVVDSVKTYQEYEAALNSAAATAGFEKGTAEYEAMNAAAREAGRTTVKTAKESAQALEYMALAGWSVEDSTKALMPVLKLSAATGMDLAQTSDLVTDSMASMGMTINDLPHYLDVLAKGNVSANYSAQEMLEAYIGVGGVLSNLNVPVEKSAAVLGVMADQGLKGTEAGTALNAILVNMQKRSGDSFKAMSKLGVSMYDTNGKARDLIDVFQDIHDKTAGMTEEQRNLAYQMIGGKAHYEDFVKIMKGFNKDAETGTTRVNALTKAYENSNGALDKFYDIKTDTFEGSLKTLQSAYEGMLIDIGEHTTSPIVKNAIKNLTANIPQIENVIVGALEKIIPAVSKVIDYVTKNADKILKTVINIAKAFALLKIGTGALRGMTETVSLMANLSKLASVRGIGPVLKGVIGTFTGIGSAAGAAGGAVGAFLSGLIIPAATVAGVVALGVAIDRAANYSAGMNKQAAKLEQAAAGVVKYNDLMQQVQQARLTIKNPESSAAEVEAARSKLKEIAELLGNEFNLTINADTSQLEEAVAMAQQLSRAELINTGKDFTNKATKGAKGYANDAANVTRWSAELEQASQMQTTYTSLNAAIESANTAYNRGTITQEKYMEQMNGVLNTAREAGIQFDYIGDTLDANAGDIQRMSDTIYKGMTDTNGRVADLKTDIADATSKMKEFDESTQKAGNALIAALASDTAAGNLAGIDTDISLLNDLGAALVKAGKPTQELAASFAAASVGYTDFSKAIADGKAPEMTQSFIEYSKAIGESAENTVSGAALIANGFNDVASASAAGDEALNNIINTMAQIGNQQGLFDGLDSGGIADKLTDMAHALNLIPENKSIAISADGNFEVIQEAENQIASLNAIGNVDVSVNANGDFTILNEASGEIQTLQGMGAVDLTVNADGNIDVLDKAGEVIATIDSKNAQVSVDGHVMGMDQIEQAKAQADGLQDKSVSQTVVGSFNGQDVIATAIDYQSKLQDANRAQTVNGQFPGQDKIATAISYQSQLHDKTVTYTVNYVQNGTPPANSATGQTNWRGGLTYVNDQNIADPREVIEYGGRRWYYEGKNILADIPKGARIYNAAQSRPMINGSHAGGLASVPFDGYVAELHRGERVLTAEEASDYRAGGGFGDLAEFAREMLGGGDSGGSSTENNGGNTYVFSPNITVSGGASETEARDTAKSMYSMFVDFIERYNRDQRRRSFGA